MILKKLFLLLPFLIFGILIFAQPANDNCTGAQVISLPAPAACPSGNGATVTVFGSTINATASNPYPSMTGCFGGGSQRSPALDVWYSFVATGNVLNLQINSAFATPNIGLWTGACASLV